MIPKSKLLPLITLIGLLLWSSLWAQREEPKKTMIRGEPMYTVLEPGAIPAIFDPEFIDVDSARSLYYPDEPLLAVVVDGQARAYSTWHLDRHEVVNDRIAGTAIAATW